MKSTPLSLFAALFALILSASVAPAQATRTWVSGIGDDANPCSRTAPCKTFAGAISKTAANGEINVLDPGGYGAVTITKSITIDGHGTLASILSSGTTGVIVNAATNDVVTLRNLSINGGGSGIYGVRVLQAGVVRIENCVIFNLTTNALEFVPSNPNPAFHLANTHIFESGGAGVSLRPATTASVVIENSIIERCATGVQATGGTASLSETTVTANKGPGLLTSGTGAIKTFRNNRVFGNNPDGGFTGSLPLR